MKDRTAKPAERTSRIDVGAAAAMVMCTDIAYDPDDAVSLALAAMTVENLTVITSDETGGRRARWTRGFLDALGRPDVGIAAGPDTGEASRFLMDDIIAGVPDQSTEILAVVTKACESTEGLILQLHSRDSMLVDLPGGVGSRCGRAGFVDEQDRATVHPCRASCPSPRVCVGAAGWAGTQERVDAG